MHGFIVAVEAMKEDGDTSRRMYFVPKPDALHALILHKQICETFHTNPWTGIYFQGEPSKEFMASVQAIEMLFDKARLGGRFGYFNNLHHASSFWGNLKAAVKPVSIRMGQYFIEGRDSLAEFSPEAEEFNANFQILHQRIQAILRFQNV